MLPAPLGQAGRVSDVATRRHCATLRARQRLVADGAVVVQIERAPFALGDLELAEGKGGEAEDSDQLWPRASRDVQDAMDESLWTPARFMDGWQLGQYRFHSPESYSVYLSRRAKCAWSSTGSVTRSSAAPSTKDAATRGQYSGQKKKTV